MSNFNGEDRKTIMNIKYYYGKAICLLLLLSAAMACTDSRVIDPDEGSDVEVPIMLNLKGLFSEEDVPPTYTLTPGGDAPGAGAENTVTDVRIFIFNAITNACERIIAVSSLVNPIGPELVKSGNKNIVVVVNGNGKFNKNPFYTAGEENQINYNGLRYMLTEPVANLPAAPFLMTAEKNVMLQPYQPSNAPNQIDLEVKRSVAKVKIFVKKSGDALSHHLWLKTVTLHQGADRVSTLYNLLGDPNVITYNLDSVSTNFDPATRVIPNSGYCQVLDTFYTYETLASRDKSKAVYFDFEVEVNAAANIRKCRVYLAEDALSATDTVYNVYRNHWYNVYVDIVKPGLDSVYVKVIASPWNVADTIRIIEGAGFETQQASPFKLVKYYDTDDLTKDPTIAAIDKHSKGASWINVKVTENTNWELNFTSSGGGNANSILSADTGKHWSSSLSGTGTNEWQRIYIYRPYVENNEPKEGPSVTLKVGGQNVRTFTVHPRDSLIFPTNSYLLRPYNFSGLGRSETFIPLNHVYDFWEDFLLVNGDTIPGGSTPTVDLSWQDNPGTTIQGSPAIINATDRRNSYIRAEAGPAQGNVILDFKVNGTVYWSFHIWNTEYSPYELAGQLLYKTSASTPVKNFFMDRNLGAMDTLYTPSGSAQGLNYQFGRKDPFPWWILDNNNVEYVWYEFPGPVRKTTITTA
ncbi:MAG: hypothetical protein LBS79_06260, partial [Tannerella sp.]|nr:hypothetical protein [Tannerella sp.]